MDAFLVTEPQYIKRVLMTDATTYEKGPEFRSQFLDLLGNGVLTSEGDLWKFHRGMTRPFLNKHRYSDLQLFYDHTETLINRLKDRMREGFPADWQDLAHRYTLDTATTFLFGHDFRSLAADLPCPPLHPSRELSSDGKRVHHFFHAFQQAQVQTARRLRYGRFWPLFEFWRNRVREHVNVIESFLEPVIESVVLREKHHPRSAECQDEETLLEYLTRLTDDQRLIKDQTMNLLIGARDTTASTLTSAVYVLTQRPDVCQRLRREVVDMVGHRVPSYDDLHKMKYLRAFINEVLRLYPPVPITIRASTRPTVWPAAGPTEKPVYIPAHTRIYVALLIMHRRKDLWGPDADEFDPDRWLDERLHKYFIPNPSIFLPFHAGPRICLGQQFAYNSLSFVLVRLLQSFSQFELVLYDDDASESSSRSGVEFQTHLTMFVKGALWIKMQEPVEDPI
ncbi:uncharacterized protein PHACADRAFT_198361 [Phanerochaete carnosa HHB-10118-sp]|uniref:Cytochrome P450 n=1 Tax=Phanerochaete carnosa (strain HHB-10118-sp) TaxID=650164 RepID=K5W0C1_PHACS|nr:uncharacterized protein PHACADRAFT_198361 [Phanerochaete carnosa HHB-10118-sp]EKM52294.1 hypothetical protein PHACADRAFT_198361 [Phanerochaete carnosa HHB-10118-sp]